MSELSGREPVVIVGGFLSQPSDYLSWKAKLEKPPYNRRTYISEVSRLQWVTSRDDSFRAQIPALQAIVERARRETKAEKVWLVAHSAGGRVARLWMGDKNYSGLQCGGHTKVRGLICLGSPYTTQEPWAKRSASFANQNYPGAFYQDIKYLSIIGKSVFARVNGNLTERAAWQSYRLLNPQNPAQWGDGVITIESATIPAAENIVLDGIYHTGLFGRPGYGVNQALTVWAKALT